MPTTTTIVWHPEKVIAKLHAAHAEAVVGAGRVAVERAEWRHVKGAIHAAASGSTGAIICTAPDWKWLEMGTHAHSVAPRNLAMKINKGDGGFVRGPVRVSGLTPHPFMRPAAAAYPLLYMARARF